MNAHTKSYRTLACETLSVTQVIMKKGSSHFSVGQINVKSVSELEI
jgi:hypothetical protein